MSCPYGSKSRRGKPRPYKGRKKSWNGGWVAWMVQLAGWARDVADLDHGNLVLELEEVFAVDGAVGVKELVGDVTQDGGAAWRDTPFGNKDQELGEELVDVNGGLKLGEFGEEFPGEVEGIIWRLLEPGADGGTLG